MKGFEKFTFDAKLLRDECDLLKDTLKPGMGLSLDEDRHLSSVLKPSPNLVSVIGSAFGGVTDPDLIASEYWILDKLRCDFAVCNSRKGKFCFIEIENAVPRSIFVERKPTLHNGLMGRPPYFDWADRFEHGTSQILDWIRILADSEKTDDFRAHFGSSNRFDAEFILVIGRDEYLDANQKERLAWRSKNVVTGGYKVKCITYDQVLDEAEYELATYGPAAAASASPIVAATTATSSSAA
jgi:hypothetical protein